MSVAFAGSPRASAWSTGPAGSSRRPPAWSRCSRALRLPPDADPMGERRTMLLASHAGVFASQHAHKLEVTATELAACVRRGDVVRVRRGAYVAGALYRSARDRALPERVRAVLASRPSGDIASHPPALALLGLPLWRVDLRRIDVVSGVTAYDPQRAGRPPAPRTLGHRVGR